MNNWFIYFVNAPFDLPNLESVYRSARIPKYLTHYYETYGHTIIYTGTL